MAVLKSEVFKTKAGMKVAKKQIKAEIHEMFGLTRQQVRIPHDLIILQRKLPSNQWINVTSRITDFSKYMETSGEYRLKTPDLILKKFK